MTVPLVDTLLRPHFVNNNWFEMLHQSCILISEHPATNLRAKFPVQMLSDVGLALLNKFLTYDPKKRITCEAALKDFYFDESPQAIDPSMFPTW